MSLERLRSKCEIEPMSGCWLWMGTMHGAGYGIGSQVGGRQVLAHRLAYTLAYGPVPDGLYVCHHCDVRCCINPAHLYAGTAKDNTRDALSRGRIRVGVDSLPHKILTNLAMQGKIVGQKLSPDDVREIRKALASGVTQQALADKYGVRQTSISKIKLGARWGFL